MCSHDSGEKFGQPGVSCGTQVLQVLQEFHMDVVVTWGCHWFRLLQSSWNLLFSDEVPLNQPILTFTEYYRRRLLPLLWCCRMFAISNWSVWSESSPLCYRQHGNVTEYGKPLNPTLDLQVALFASSKKLKNTRCAASDVNPVKIRFNLQITKATVNETQWLHVIT